MRTTDRLITDLKVMVELRLTAYRDEAGVLTIGYGHRGPDIEVGDRISEYWAKELLEEDVAHVAMAVKELRVARTEGQLDALVSLTLSIGIEELKQSTLLRVIRARGSKADIKREFKRWVYCQGKVLPGLVKRREWESKRFFE